MVLIFLIFLQDQANFEGRLLLLENSLFSLLFGLVLLHLSIKRHEILGRSLGGQVNFVVLLQRSVHQDLPTFGISGMLLRFCGPGPLGNVAGLAVLAVLQEVEHARVV